MNSSMYHYLDEIVHKYHEKTAFCYIEQGEIQPVSYAQFARDVDCAAAGFRDYQGGHIAILAKNSYAYLVNLLGIMAADAVVILLNAEESWDVLKRQMEAAGIDLLLHDGEYAEAEPELLQLYSDRMELLKTRITVKPPVHSHQYDDPEGFALMLFTSGSSDIGKGVMLTAENLIGISHGHAKFFDYAVEKFSGGCVRFYLCLPLYHAFQLSTVLACLEKGCTTGIGSSRSHFVRDIELLQCNCAAMVPSMLQVLAKHLKHNRKEKLEKLRLIITAGAASSAELIDTFEQNGIRIIKHYGMSENSVTTANYLPYPNKQASVGNPFGDTEVTIQNDEILVRGCTMMQGYYKNPAATAEAIRDGWFHTGDLGYLDEDGYLYITGRKKNLIILSTGENVNPEELEGLLMHNPDVMETIVVEKNARICAQIYCIPEKQEEIRHYVDEVNTQVALYKRIGQVEFREEPFPRTASGKIKRV